MTEPTGRTDASTGQMAAGLQDDGLGEGEEAVPLITLTRHQAERIHDLEQALDESLLSLQDIRARLIEQHFLESQLAATEETANVQQQAILQLKQQLTRLQQTLLEQTGLMIVPAEQLSADQSSASETRLLLPLGTAGLRTAAVPTAFTAQQQRLAALEAEVFSARVFAASLGVWLYEALADVRQLIQQDGDDSPWLHSLESHLQQALQYTQDTLQRQSERALKADGGTVLSPLFLAEGALEPSALTQQELAIAQSKLQDLETEMVRQISIQTLLQHANRELEQEREQQQARVLLLERQTAELQEQILQQAQQSTEYETAVQHWKDRYDTHRSQIQRLKELVGMAVPPGSAEIIEILDSLQDPPESAGLPGSPEISVASAQQQSAKLDLPDFLMQRRRYKARRSS